MSSHLCLLSLHIVLCYAVLRCALPQLPWDNFRLSHSDGKPYGDLDPRFLDEVNSGENPFRNIVSSVGTVHSALFLCAAFSADCLYSFSVHLIPRKTIVNMRAVATKHQGY